MALFSRSLGSWGLLKMIHRFVSIFDRSRSHSPLIRFIASRVALLIVICIVSIAVSTPTAWGLQNRSVETAKNAGQASGVSLSYSGTVAFPAGTSTQPILVDVYQGKLPTDETELFLTMRSIDGGFQFESDRIGPMTIHARTEDSNYQSVEHSTVNRLLQLSQTKISIRMEKARMVELKVIDHELPVGEASVLLLTWESLPFIGTTDRSGVAKIRLPKSALVRRIRAQTADSRLANLNLVKERSESQLADEYLLPLVPSTKNNIIPLDQSGKPMPNFQEVDCEIELPEGCAAGLVVHGSSFESVEKNMSTVFYSRIDQNGRFKARVVPGYTYDVSVEDALWVSSPWHGVIVDEESGILNSPPLSISRGIPVEITVTTGVLRRPLANHRIRVHSPHEYQWKDRLSGSIKRGSSGVDRQTITDSSGRATIMTTPGELQAHLVNGSQYTEGRLDVSLGQPATLALHLAIDGHTELSGRVKLPVGTSAKFEKFQVRFEQADSMLVYPENQTTCDAEGRFKADIEASRVMIYAESNDKEYSGAMVTSSDKANIELLVAKTGGIDGRLLNETGLPHAGCKVLASATIHNNTLAKSANRGFLTTNTIKVGYWEVLTDSQGNFSFRGLPTSLRVAVGVKTKETETYDLIEDVVLAAGEVRTIEPVRLNQKPNLIIRPLADQFATLLQTNRLLYTRAMVVVSGGGGNAKRFVDDHVLDFDEHPDVCWYIPLSLSAATLNEQATDLTVSNEKSWMLEDAEMVLVVAYDTQGLEMGRQKIDTSKANHEAASVQSYEQFLETHKPPQEDAEEKLDRAIAEAKATNRRVWVVCSGTRCGPCRVMARWMDAQHALLSKAVIHVHLDLARDLNMVKVLQRLNEPQAGIPWHAILDANGNILINSETELLGNVGAPDKSPESLTHFRKMIKLAGKGQLSEKELESLVESVKNN